MNRTVLKTLSVGTLLIATTTLASCATDLDHEISARGGTEGETGDVGEPDGPTDLAADGPRGQALTDSCDGTICCPEGQTPRLGTSGADHEVNKDPDVCFVMLEGDDEVINNSKGTGSALGGEGDDYLRGPKGPGLLAGGDGDDRIVGNGSADEIYGGDGADHIMAGSGDDLVVAGKGDDVVHANNGADRIIPGPGRDEVDAGGGDDTVTIYDVCELEPGEVLDGGAAGFDTLVTPVDVAELESLGVTVIGFENIVLDDSHRCEAECTPDFGETCPAGSNEITGTPGPDVLVGTPEVDCIIGLGGNDVLRGLDGDDVLWGGCGDDHLVGGAGDDSLHGAPGSDGLVGGAGADVMRGEQGDDFFGVFAACEVASGEEIDGGDDEDRVLSPFSAAELSAQGANLLSVETSVELTDGQLDCGPSCDCEAAVDPMLPDGDPCDPETFPNEEDGAVWASVCADMRQNWSSVLELMNTTMSVDEFAEAVDAGFPSWRQSLGQIDAAGGGAVDDLTTPLPKPLSPGTCPPGISHDVEACDLDQSHLDTSVACGLSKKKLVDRGLKYTLFFDWRARQLMDAVIEAYNAGSTALAEQLWNQGTSYTRSDGLTVDRNVAWFFGDPSPGSAARAKYGLDTVWDALGGDYLRDKPAKFVCYMRPSKADIAASILFGYFWVYLAEFCFYADAPDAHTFWAPSTRTIMLCDQAFERDTETDEELSFRLGGLFLHELLHWHKNAQGNYYQDHLLCGLFSCCDGPCYGYPNVHDLASEHPGEAARNPDTYRYFSLEVGKQYVDDVNVGGDCLCSGPFDIATGQPSTDGVCFPSDCCGNGNVDEDMDEECDGTNFDGEDCMSLENWCEGQLLCTPACEIDSAACHGSCGNGCIDPAATSPVEECDGDDLGGQTCSDHGFEYGNLACDANCQFDTSECHNCGNGEIDPGEECDVGVWGAECQPGQVRKCDFWTCKLICDTPGDRPSTYEDCWAGEAECDDAESCSNTDLAGACLGGPCAPTNPLADRSDPNSDFHPRGNFYTGTGNSLTLYQCNQLAADEGQDAVCVDVDGWGMCALCEYASGDTSTALGCKCGAGSQFDCEAATPPLSCFGEAYPNGGYCWEEPDGRPFLHCAEGRCGQNVRVPDAGEGETAAETYCEPYASQPARCQSTECDDLMEATECSATNPRVICPASIVPPADCILECETADDCKLGGWPNENNISCIGGACVP